VDASARLTIVSPRGGTGDLALTLRADNLLDRSYQEIRNYPSRGRTLFIGVSAGSR
jgi:outer membrane cobalamin receptor